MYFEGFGDHDIFHLHYLIIFLYLYNYALYKEKKGMIILCCGNKRTIKRYIWNIFDALMIVTLFLVHYLFFYCPLFFSSSRKVIV